MAKNRPPSVLSIAGSDSGGGAGIQADLKTFSALGVHGLTAISALTAQTTTGVRAVHLPPSVFLSEQIACLFEDFDIRAVKVGMLANAELVHCVADALAAAGGPPMVLDPVMIASSGARLLEDQAIVAMKSRLLPMATVLTPNLPEAEALLDETIAPADAESAGHRLLALGPQWVLLKGGHLAEGDSVTDRLFGTHSTRSWSNPRLALQPHGTGCTLSSAIAALLARGMGVEEACALAITFVHLGLRHAYCPGLGPLAVLGHAQAGRSSEGESNPGAAADC
jgi:hydroxymethylpyrimidine/phosphomethylpyrimidine kinase